jgi:hypothetical protein
MKNHPRAGGKKMKIKINTAKKNGRFHPASVLN